MNARSTETCAYLIRFANTVPSKIEETILLSFGHSKLDFEDTLYMKFQHLTRDIALTKKELVEHLENMEERGLIASGVLRGRKCWSLKTGESAIWVRS